MCACSLFYYGKRFEDWSSLGWLWQGRSSLINIGKANFGIEHWDLVHRVVDRMHASGKGVCPHKVLVWLTPVHQTPCDAYVFPKNLAGNGNCETGSVFFCRILLVITTNHFIRMRVNGKGACLRENIGPANAGLPDPLRRLCMTIADP